MSAALSTRDLSVRFGGVQALRAVSIEVPAGQIVGLIGPNGAGKTTLIDAIGGFVPASGAVSLDGADVSRAAPHVRARRGLRRTWQNAELFDDLTVAENLSVAAAERSAWATVRQLAGARSRAEASVAEALALLDLDAQAELMPDALTEGQRKLVGVARALVGQPRVICLDEPAAGLDTDESAELGARLRRLPENGTAMLLVEHDMGLVMSICDHVVVLEFGEVIASGPPEQVRLDERVVEAYLGSAHHEGEEAPR